MSVGFFEPQQIQKFSENDYRLNNFAQFSLQSYNILPQAFQELISRPPEYYFCDLYVQEEQDQLIEDFKYKGEIWSLGILMRFCMQSKLSSENYDNYDQIQFIEDFYNIYYLQNDPIFLKTPYLEEYINPLHQFLAGYEGVENCFSYLFRDLVSQMLSFDIQNRPNAQKLLSHPIFKNIQPQQEENEEENIQQIYVKIIKYGDFTKLEKLFPLDVIVDLFGENIETFLASPIEKFEPFLFQKNYSLHTKQKTLNINTTDMYNNIKEEIVYYQNVLKNVKEIQTLIEYLGLNTLQMMNNSQKKNNQQNNENINESTIIDDESTIQQQESSISFGFFTKMKISEKVTKFWSKQQDKSINNNENSTLSNSNNNFSNTIVNDLFPSSENEVDFTPFLHQNAPQTPFSQKIKTYLFYMNIIYEDRRIISPKCIHQFLVQADLPQYLRFPLYQKIMVLPKKVDILYEFLSENELMYDQKQQCLKTIQHDIPRCHQYSLYCSGKEGKAKIYQILKAFLNLNPKYYYIQSMDSMAFVALSITRDYDSAYALLILQEFVKKSLQMHCQQNSEDYILKEKTLIYKWLLRFEDPQLSDYLEERQLYAEIYTISWFLNLFSMVFDINTVVKIWDLIICDPNFTICFGVAAMIELKDYLLLKDQNQLIQSIRNLQGVQNTKKSLKYAQYLLKALPEQFLVLNYIQSEKDKSDYQNQFFKECPWEIPPNYDQLCKRSVFYVSIFDVIKQKHVVYVDIRQKNEYEDVCVKNSLFAHFQGGRIHELVINYLEKKCAKFSSFDTVFEENLQPDYVSLIAIIFNYERQKDMEDCVHQLLRVGIRRLVVLNGGIQSVIKDRPDLLENKHRIQPINYFKRKQQ